MDLLWAAAWGDQLLRCHLALVRHRYIQRSLHSDNAGRQGHRGELLLPLGFGQLVMLIPIHGSVTAQISLLFKPRYSRTIYILRVTSVRANLSVLWLCSWVIVGPFYTSLHNYTARPPHIFIKVLCHIFSFKGNKENHGGLVNCRSRTPDRAIGSFSWQKTTGDIALMPLDQAVISAKGKREKAITSKHHILIGFIATICQRDTLGFYRRLCTKICHGPR